MRTKTFIALMSFLAILVASLAAQAPAERPGGGAAPPQTIDARTTGFQKLDGYMPLYWDQKTGSLWMEINKFDTEMLYSTGLAAGLGSNDIGLDRGQAGQGRVVKFQRIGPRVMMVQPNYTFRANSPNPDERRAVEDAFAKSILWGFTVGAETDGRVLVDATDFFLRDAHNVIPRLRPGTYRVDRTRSAIDMPWTKGFPKNTEVDAILTFANDGAGRRPRGSGGGPAQGPPQVGAPIPGGGGVRRRHVLGHGGSVTPTADAVTLREHHTFAELPDGNYKPRYDDPRAGYWRPAVRGLRRAARHADGAALRSAPSSRESRSVGAGQRREEADHLLRRSRHAGADPLARCSKARGGGTRRSRRPAIATRSASSCCPKAPIRWTSATT